MPLEPRLQAVADLIEARVHADIGSDHALLPRYLLERGRVAQVIVVEKNAGPYHKARHALQRYPQADVRRGDGLEPLQKGEVDSLSMSGMGARLMLGILETYPERVPARVVLQPNARPEILRQWALTRGYHLTQERMAEGFWWYVVLALEHREGPDPAYEGVPLDVAVQFGPLLLKAGCPVLMTELQTQARYAEQLMVKGAPAMHRRQQLIQSALAFLGSEKR